jgi:phosphatidylethanolamine-binding protein (PEBP) family uncharacterized protein
MPTKKILLQFCAHCKSAGQFRKRQPLKSTQIKPMYWQTDLEQAMKGHVLEKAELFGTYQKH